MRSVRFELLRPDEIIQERVRFPVTTCHWDPWSGIPSIYQWAQIP